MALYQLERRSEKERDRALHAIETLISVKKFRLPFLNKKIVSSSGNRGYAISKKEKQEVRVFHSN